MCMLCAQEATGFAALVVTAFPMSRAWVETKLAKRRAATNRPPNLAPPLIAAFAITLAVAYILLEKFSG